MTKPFFCLFDIAQHGALFRALRKAGPERAWRLMKELRSLDEQVHVEKYAEDREEMRQIALQGMKLAPRIPCADYSREAERFSTYPHDLNFDNTFLIQWFENRSVLEQVVQTDGRENLLEAQSRGRGVLLLPLHMGPSSSAVGLTAHDFPTTVLFHKMPFEDLKELAFPNLMFDFLRLGEGNAVRRAVDVLRRGECFAIFPEYDPRGQSGNKNYMSVPFFGAEVAGPLGPASISKIAKAPMVLMSLRRVGEAQFVLKYYPSIEPPSTGWTREDATLQIWRYVEEDLKVRGVGEWEMWFDFVKMTEMCRA